MPNWKKLITSGSNAILNDITASGAINASTYYGDGSNLTGIFTPKVEYYDTTGSISPFTNFPLPNNLTFVSSSTYEYLEIFINGLRLRADRDFTLPTTSSVQFAIKIPSGSELTFKSLKQ